MTRISLTSAMSDNLRALKLLSQQMDVTQERLSSGMKVNSAIDNASNFYQSRSLTNRAADLESLLDSMGQGIQTINAALEGIEAGTSFLEQLSSVATQAATLPITTDTADGAKGVDGAAGTGAAGKARAASTKTIAEYEAEGYGVVTKNMSAGEISDLLAAKGKVVLAENVENLTASIQITTSGAIIEGNGHKITFNATEKKQAAILADGANRSVTITNLSIDVSGEKAYGIRAANGGSITIDNIMGIKIVGENSLGAQRAVNGDADLFDGATNTKILITPSNAEGTGGLGSTAKAANAANDYAISGITDAKASAELGAGTWYLPSIGEWMELRGYNAASVSGTGTSGVANYADSDMEKVNNALSELNTIQNGLADTLLTASGGNKYYWSSSEYSASNSWEFHSSDGYRYNNYKFHPSSVRCFQLIENCFNPLPLSDGTTAAKPEIGDVMYVNKPQGRSRGVRPRIIIQVIPAKLPSVSFAT